MLIPEFSTPISGATRLAAVIGDPVRHSLSPAIHNAGFAAASLDWRYVALPVAAGRGADAVRAMDVLGIDGLSVTMPHKADVAAALDHHTPAVEALGVCNCVFRTDGGLVGDNTDGDGFVAAVESETTRRIAGSTVVVIGAGGAARSIIEALGRAGAASIGIVNRTVSAARSAAELADAASVVDLDAVPVADIVINTTSVGMLGGPVPDQSPVPAELLTDRQLVADIIYSPANTQLMIDASAAGATVMGGLPMLIHQAVAQFEHWTGVTAPLAAMSDAALSVAARARA